MDQNWVGRDGRRGNLEDRHVFIRRPVVESHAISQFDNDPHPPGNGLENLRRTSAFAL